MDNLDWEFGTDYYSDSKKKVRSFEEIVAECDKDSALEAKLESHDENAEVKAIAEKVGKIKALSSEGHDITYIVNELGYDREFVTDTLITISGSPEDDTDMAIAYLLHMSK